MRQGAVVFTCMSPVSSPTSPNFCLKSLSGGVMISAVFKTRLILFLAFLPLLVGEMDNEGYFQISISEGAQHTAYCTMCCAVHTEQCTLHDAQKPF